jgi:hypothetical protein
MELSPEYFAVAQQAIFGQEKRLRDIPDNGQNASAAIKELDVSSAPVNTPGRDDLAHAKGQTATL